MIKFLGGGGEVVDGEGVAVKDAFQKHLKTVGG